MKIFKGAQKFLISKLESPGINLAFRAETTGLTPEQDGRISVNLTELKE